MPIRAPPPPAARLKSEGFQWFSSPTSRSTVTPRVISAGISTSFDTFRFSSAMVALLGSSDVDERPHSNTVDVRPEVTDEVRWLERDHSRLLTSGRRRSAGRRSLFCLIRHVARKLWVEILLTRKFFAFWKRFSWVLLGAHASCVRGVWNAESRLAGRSQG